MSNVPTDVSEYDAIAKIIQHYIDGARSGKGDDMKPAFHKDATVFVQGIVKAGRNDSKHFS